MDIVKVVAKPVKPSGKLAPYRYLVAEVEQVITEEVDRLPTLFGGEYAWYSHENKRKALEQCEGVVLAVHLHLARQVRHYNHQLFQILAKDRAEYVAQLAKQKLGFRGEITCHQYAALPGHLFRVPIAQNARRQLEWVFYPIEQFDKQIPLPALKAIQRLAEEAIQPDAFWVADKIETVIDYQRSVDPILCAQFGPWFAGLAFWMDQPVRVIETRPLPRYEPFSLGWLDR